MHVIRIALLVAVSVTSLAPSARAQSTAQPSGADKDWKVTLYPLVAWVPLSINLDVNVPPIEGGGDAGGSGDILDARFDGAFFGGLAITNNVWRVDSYGLWAAVGGDRPDTPFLVVDLDVIYGTATLGRRIAPDLFISGGVRRLAFKYDVTLNDLPRLSRKPGVWDPIVGIGWHRVGNTVEWHATFDGGGFGVGAEVDLGASVRVDWKPVRYFGFTAGYNLLYLKVTDTVLGRDITVKPTLHGPAAGIGFYF